MTQLERRIKKLEKKLGLGPSTYAELQLRARLQAARRRMAAWSGQDMPLEAEPEVLPAVRASRFGNDLASRILRARARLRREQELREQAHRELDSESGGAS